MSVHVNCFQVVRCVVGWYGVWMLIRLPEEQSFNRRKSRKLGVSSTEGKHNTGLSEKWKSSILHNFWHESIHLGIHLLVYEITFRMNGHHGSGFRGFQKFQIKWRKEGRASLILNMVIETRCVGTSKVRRTELCGSSNPVVWPKQRVGQGLKSIVWPDLPCTCGPQATGLSDSLSINDLNPRTDNSKPCPVRWICVAGQKQKHSAVRAVEVVFCDRP